MINCVQALTLSNWTIENVVYKNIFFRSKKSDSHYSTVSIVQLFKINLYKFAPQNLLTKQIHYFMEDLLDGNVVKLLTMVLVGALAGTLAARIMKGDHFGFVTNAILGIAGAVVGGTIFNFLGITAGAGIVKIIDNTFGVQLPQNFVGMIVSATLGAILIMWVGRLLKKGRRK